MKRSEIKRRPLADSVLKVLEPEKSVYREKDSPGLYFQVTPKGHKSWVLRYKQPADGKWTWFGLGKFPTLTGKQARIKASEWIAQIDQGTDPLVAPVLDEAVTFRTVAEAWYETKRVGARKEKTLSRMRAHLDNDILPLIGDKPLDTVGRRECAEIVKTIADRGASSMAVKVGGWLKQIYSNAIAEGFCENNPASEIQRLVEHKETNHPFLLESELPDFLRALDKADARFITMTLVKMIMLTLCRTGEARQATWDEIDLVNAEWSIPGRRMKMGLPFVTPLCTQLVEDLQLLKALTGRQAYLFPGNGAKNPTLSATAVNKVIERAGYKDRIVGHGFRHTGSTLLREHNWRRDYVETQLAHREGGTAGVYNKAQYLEQRRTMMQWYADYLDALKAGITDDLRTQFNEAVR